MVFAVILLFTVSTFAAHVHAVPTRELRNVVQHACEGKTLCDIKPKDYPEEEMDGFVAQNLPKKFFTIKTKSGVPERVIQSGLFGQTVSVVECQNPNETCFEDITNSIENEKYTCETVYTDVYFLVLAKGKPEIRSSKIATDCMCAKQEY